MRNNELLEVALLGKTVGLKGALKLHDKSDFPSQFKKGAKFYLMDGSVLTISSFNKTNSTVVFEGYEDINLASYLTNKILYQSKEITEKTCKLKKDEFFYFDILGLSVIENNRLLGVVKNIVETGPYYLFEIKTDDFFVKQGNSGSFYIPYIDNYVLKISLKDKKIFTKNAISILECS